MTENRDFTLSHEVQLLIEEAKAVKDPIAKQSAQERLIDIAERLTVGHTHFQSFNDLLISAETGYRPTLQSSLGDQFKALADLYDYGQVICGRTARAYRG